MSHVQTSAWMKMKDQHQSNDEPLAFRLSPGRGVKVSVRLEGSAASSASPDAARAEQAQEKEMTRLEESASLLKRIDNEKSECGNNVPPSIMQQRTAEETEAAHDLLQLAYSLPPTQTIPEEKQRPSVMAAATMLMMMAREESSKQQQTNNYPPLTPPISDCSSSDGRCSPESRNSRNNSRNNSRYSSRNNNRFRCSDCGRDYATSSNLSRHRQTHRAVESGGSKSCPTCGKTYVSMPALSMHLLTHQLGHICPVCGKAFSRPWLLQGHVRSHTGEKPYRCDRCCKAFADRSNLRAHLQTHSTTKSFRCSQCHKTFALKSYLHKHQETSNCQLKH